MGATCCIGGCPLCNSIGARLAQQHAAEVMHTAKQVGLTDEQEKAGKDQPTEKPEEEWC